MAVEVTYPTPELGKEKILRNEEISNITLRQIG